MTASTAKNAAIGPGRGRELHGSLLRSRYLFDELFEMFGFGFQLVAPLEQPRAFCIFAATHGLGSVLCDEICGAAYSFISRHGTAMLNGARISTLLLA